MASRILICTLPIGDTPQEPQSPHVASEAASRNATGVLEHFVPRWNTGLRLQGSPEVRVGGTLMTFRVAHRISSLARIAKVQLLVSLGSRFRRTP